MPLTLKNTRPALDSGHWIVWWRAARWAFKFLSRVGSQVVTRITTTINKPAQLRWFHSATPTIGDPILGGGAPAKSVCGPTAARQLAGILAASFPFKLPIKFIVVRLTCHPFSQPVLVRPVDRQAAANSSSRPMLIGLALDSYQLDTPT